MGLLFFPIYSYVGLIRLFLVSEFKVLEFVDALSISSLYLVTEPRNFVVICIKEVKGALRLRVIWWAKTT